MECNKKQKYRIVTMITSKEREALKILATEDGRSMSSYLRYLLVREIGEYLEPQ